MASVYECDFSAGLSGKNSLVVERVNAGKRCSNLVAPLDTSLSCSHKKIAQ